MFITFHKKIITAYFEWGINTKIEHLHQSLKATTITKAIESHPFSSIAQSAACNFLQPTVQENRSFKLSN